MDIKHYRGSSNVSAAVALDAQRFVVADDEDNQLSIFDTQRAKALKPAITLSGLFDEIQDGDHAEIDLEGATQIDEVYLWIGSHSTSSKAKPRPARQRLFGLYITETEPGKFIGTRYGGIYRHLLTDLKRDSRFAGYRLDRAEQIAPKAIGGLSIEGLAATPAKGVLIGFRNPLSGGVIEADNLVGGKALLVLLRNPLAVLHGQSAQFDAPIELDLDGLGIRDIVWRQDHQYLIVAGPYHANEQRREKHRLYLWDYASGSLQQLDHIDLADWNIEAALFFPGRTDRVELLTDEGDSKGFQSISVALQA